MQEESHNKSQLFARLEKLRVVRDWSWDELAKAVGVNRSFFFHVKAGRKTFGPRVLYRFEQLEADAGLGERGPPAVREVKLTYTRQSPSEVEHSADLLRLEDAVAKIAAALEIVQDEIRRMKQ